MPLTFAAKNQPRITAADAVSQTYRGIRGFAKAASSSVTLTISAQTVGKEWGFYDRAAGSIQLAVTDLFIYTDSDAADLVVNSGNDQIWGMTFDTGNHFYHFITSIMADKNKDLVFVLTGATANCAIAMTGQGLYTHTD